MKEEAEEERRRRRQWRRQWRRRRRRQQQQRGRESEDDDNLYRFFVRFDSVAFARGCTAGAARALGGCARSSPLRRRSSPPGPA